MNMIATESLKSKNYPQLIPSHRKTERKLLSVLMAVMDIVPRFRARILEKCEYNSGRTCSYQSFMEPHYEIPNLPARFPDGLIVCQRGQSTWSAFIEAKAEKNKIRADQIQEYADFASTLEVDAVISISNEFAFKPDELPYYVAASKRRKRQIYHLSWSEIRTELDLFIHSDNECHAAEIAVLKQCLEFLENEKSGVANYDAMPRDWDKFVESANTAIGFGANTPGVMDIVHGWQQERRDLCAKLNSDLGGGLELRHPAGVRASIDECTELDKRLLINDYKLIAGYYFKSKKCRMQVVADLRACCQRISVEIPLPHDKQAKGTITWLRGAVADLRSERHSICIDWPGHGQDAIVDLEQLRNFPETIYEGQKTAPKRVELYLAHRNVRRFKNRKRFIEDLEGVAMRLARDMRQLGLW